MTDPVDHVPAADPDTAERLAYVDSEKAQAELNRAKARFINLAADFMAAAVPLLTADFLKFAQSLKK